jgi:hypothetical protein
VREGAHGGADGARGSGFTSRPAGWRCGFGGAAFGAAVAGGSAGSGSFDGGPGARFGSPNSAPPCM